MTFQEKLLQILKSEQVLVQESMSRHTTFRTGGVADYYLKPEIAQVSDVVKICREEQVPFYVIGNGSNILVGDKGIRGAVLEIASVVSDVVVEGSWIYVKAGASLAKIAQTAAKAGLTGFEFAAGIPGTIGGAVVMNAGAYGGEMKDVLEWAVVLKGDGTVEKYKAEDLDLSYRHSIVPEVGGIVLEAALKLQKGNPEEISRKMQELKEQRIEKQPLEYPSAGSTFKRPEGHFAGKLIMDAGLGGYQIGGAQVSQKHCGFLINRENATSKEILQLMEYVVEIVEKKFGVTLEAEVKLLGEF